MMGAINDKILQLCMCLKLCRYIRMQNCRTFVETLLYVNKVYHIRMYHQSGENYLHF